MNTSGKSQDEDVESIVAALTGMMLLWRSPQFQENFNEAAGPAFDSTEGWIVWTLREHQGLRPVDLVRQLGINAPSITKALARLTLRGMVVKLPHLVDARSLRVELTEAGRAAAEQMNDAASELIATALQEAGGLGGQDFSHALRRLSLGMQRAARRLLE